MNWFVQQLFLDLQHSVSSLDEKRRRFMVEVGHAIVVWHKMTHVGGKRHTSLCFA